MFKKCVENVRNNVPLVHNITNYVTVNDVSNVCTFLLSNAARWITGQNIVVDGGYTIQ